MANVPSAKQQVQAYCPGCGKFHIAYVYWTGTCKQIKIYCKSCRDIASRQGVIKERRDDLLEEGD